MVLFFPGKSTCSICARVIERSEKYVGFTAFLPSEHSLWRHSDSAMHAACYETWPHRGALESAYAQFTVAQERLRTPEAREERRRRDMELRVEQNASAAAHNEQHAAVVARARERGAECPRCGGLSSAYRELAGTTHLRLVCLRCARSFDAAELLQSPVAK